MFSFPQRTVKPMAVKGFTKNYRCVCSNQSLLSSGDRKSSSGYGEKEICLLSPVDARTPLPGNTGVVPPIPSFPGNSTLISKFRGSKSSKLVFELPDDRYKNVLSQLACATVDHIFSSHFLECKVYECPQLLKKDFSELFPKAISPHENLSVLTLSQKTKNDMSQWNEDVESERSTAEKSFIVTAQAICGVLREVGYWADFIHPSTGKAFLGSSITNAAMFETDVRYSHFGFTVEDLGCCKVISHHLWGTHVFVGAIFTNASVHSAEIRAILSKCEM